MILYEEQHPNNKQGQDGTEVRKSEGLREREREIKRRKNDIIKNNREQLNY